MEQDDGRVVTSVTKANNYGENATGDALAEGLMCLFKPTIDALDQRITATRGSQLELKEKIDTLAEELRKISELHKCPLDLDLYVKKLAGAKRKVTVVSSVLQNTQERLSKVQVQVAREAQRRRALLEPSPAMSPVSVESNASIQ
ncbi:SNARE-associated protein Snapin-like [Ischnura elegans]|uniref:SNARE-associated protein Snapin-like n=1 Tax=Ischnura elegans TaxID=197161 RepID=UPI001ED8BA4D|nr:SNARE-associated protein Snapin-like [Ischnura elegans]